MKKIIKTIFIGTPAFALPALEALIKDDAFHIAAVISQPDRPVGRKQTLTPPPVKVLAEKYRLAVWQPDKIGEIAEEIKKLKPDLIIVAAYAQLIPEEILSLPRYGCINIHASLLPRYRGASVIQAAILNGEKQTGVTIMKMDKTLDTGPILSQASLPLEGNETAATLSVQLASLGAGILVPTIKKYMSGEIKPQAQDASRASYARALKKEDGKIDWAKSAEKIERFVRAMNPWPGAYTPIRGRKEILKITQAGHQLLDINDRQRGEIFLYKNKLAVQCARDALALERLQLEGRTEMSAEEFLRGHADLPGSFLT